jgi:hypothetical protein
MNHPKQGIGTGHLSTTGSGDYADCNEASWLNQREPERFQKPVSSAGLAQ